MSRIIADLHIHSRFSRATSKNLNFVALHRAALEKGIDIVGTGDFTHPAWMAEIESQLIPAEEGLFRLKPELATVAEEGLPPACAGEVRFMLQVEISNIYKKDDRTRKNHNLVYMPSLAAAHRFSQKLAAIGNINSDGRPILGLDARDLLEITLETDPLGFLIPAHIWTPWFSMLGSKSGFDSLEECFGDLHEHIFAAETGLSSDPQMNWRLSQLDRLRLVSNSDAHSASKLGREANLFSVDLSYIDILNALKTGEGFDGTLEFYPEEGKYHLDGHRKCQLRLDPAETRKYDGRCPKCGGLITVGVMSRVDSLADRDEGFTPPDADRYDSLVPLDEVLAEVIGVGAQSKKVKQFQIELLKSLGPELNILRELPLEDIRKVGGPAIEEAIRRIRQSDLTIQPGYDGEFGKIGIFSPGERDQFVGQMTFLKTPRLAALPSTPPETKTDTIRSDSDDRQPMPTDVSPVESDPLVGLNDDQHTVATSGDGPILVVAGPGTGKTRTLVARVCHLVRAGAVKPKEILAIAFTNQAANEIQTRLDKALGIDGKNRPVVETFHSLGLRILADTIKGEVSVLSDKERLERVKTAASTCRIKRRRATSLLNRISLAKQGVNPEQFLSVNTQELTVYNQYETMLLNEGVFDIDDLVFKAHRVLAESTHASDLISTFKAILVDEYQDVNDVQAALVKLLDPDGSALMAIGDPDQAIYGFRGAKPGHFLRFKQAYPGAKVVHLNTSYRLTPQVLAVAKHVVLSSDTNQKLTPFSTRGRPVEIVSCPTAKSEAEQLVIRIEQLIGGTSHFAIDTGRGEGPGSLNIGFGDIAILSRTKAQRKEILTAISRSGIPCHSVGEDEPHDPRSEKVAVMTMHASKGREFEVVFVTGAEPNLMPLDLIGFNSEPLEERRLLYVALTRARRLAILSYANSRTLFGHTLPGGCTPFLNGLPSNSVHRTRAVIPNKKQSSNQLSLF